MVFLTFLTGPVNVVVSATDCKAEYRGCDNPEQNVCAIRAIFYLALVLTIDIHMHWKKKKKYM